MKHILFLLTMTLHINAYTSMQQTTQSLTTSPMRIPRVSIITSLYKGGAFIKGFMEDITQQTIFDQCELIIINANSPDDEESIIAPYLARYPNIKYIRLKSDPGVYGVWNRAIKLAQAPYITNANVDDRLKGNCYQRHANALDKNPTIDLVYSDFYTTHHPNETFDQNRRTKVSYLPDFSTRNMRICLPNSHPMWRKSMHKTHGFFDESYKSAGDWEMWLRAIKNGAQFLKVKDTLGLYYRNPKGLSSDVTQPHIKREFLRVYNQYKELFM